jgi:nucleoside-diphosphate-sugar epimerase
VLRGERILITGAAGQIGSGLAQALAQTNEVWGISRFSNPSQRERIESFGVRTHATDLSMPDFNALPRDFTYLVHVAVAIENNDYERALQVNAEGTGFLLSRFRNVKAALVMSSLSVYKPHPDPWHPFVESDPLGDTVAAAAAYSVSKISQEAVARFCAREFGVPVTIARMGAAYGVNGGLPMMHLQSIAAGLPVKTRWTPCPYSPIHQDDIDSQLESMLSIAATPATIINWCGDEAVSVQDWTAYMGDLLGKPAQVQVQEIPCASRGVVGDPGKRFSVTGPCKVMWKDGFRRTLAALHPGELKR